MTDEERDRIEKRSREGAQIENRIFNLEAEVKEMKAEALRLREKDASRQMWVFGAAISGLVYMGKQLWEAVINGGSLR